MALDFVKLFENYSTVDLLKMVERPSSYQESAVEAATYLLLQREITDADRKEVSQFFEPEDLPGQPLYEILDNSSISLSPGYDRFIESRVGKFLLYVVFGAFLLMAIILGISIFRFFANMPS